MAQTAVRNSQTPAAKKSEFTMHKVDEEKQADLLTWIVIGVVFSFVTAALYGPFVWEHWVA
jgi:hypothetical protein